MGFEEDKETFAQTLERVARGEEDKNNLFSLVDILKLKDEFRDKKLFMDTFDLLEKKFDQLSRKELKQTALMIRTFQE